MLYFDATNTEVQKGTINKKYYCQNKYIFNVSSYKFLIFHVILGIYISLYKSCIDFMWVRLAVKETLT